ncbi:protein kinase [Myxococcota bacterium]
MNSAATDQPFRLRYRPILALGQGGMADVHLAVGRGPGGFNKLVVLKRLRKEWTTDAEIRNMFLAEARLSARLNHPNVVQVYEVADSVTPCIVMEYLEGQAMSIIQQEAGDDFTLEMQLRAMIDVLGGASLLA